MSNDKNQDEYTFSQGRHPNFQEIKEIPGPVEKSMLPDLVSKVFTVQYIFANL